jgi:hypothetical protein
MSSKLKVVSIATQSVLDNSEGSIAAQDESLFVKLNET